MKNNNNILEKLNNDLSTIILGIQLLKNEMQEQSETPTKISPKSKEFISMIHSSVDLLARDFIPEQLQHDSEENTKKIRKANYKIRELELELGEKVSPNDISHFAKKIEKNISNAFESIGLYTAPTVSFGSYGLEVECKFIKQQIHQSYYARNQEEIEELDAKNSELKKLFYKNFDVADPQKTEAAIQVTDKNIALIEDAIYKSGTDLDIKTIETDPHNKKMAIDRIVFSKNIDNFSLSMPKSIYAED